MLLCICSFCIIVATKGAASTTEKPTTGGKCTETSREGWKPTAFPAAPSTEKSEPRAC